eukprot:1345758-Amorphochlora_amoeboformis.AAC.1
MESENADEYSFRESGYSEFVSEERAKTRIILDPYKNICSKYERQRTERRKRQWREQDDNTNPSPKSFSFIRSLMRHVRGRLRVFCGI